MSKILMALNGLTGNSLLLLLWLVLMGAPCKVSGQCIQQNEQAIKEGIVGFFGKEQLSIMQKRSFGVEVRYGAGGTLAIAVQRKRKDKQLSDTVVAVLKRFLEQTIVPGLCKTAKGKVMIDEHTSFNGVNAGSKPLITSTNIDMSAWADTLKHYIARYREQYPGDCEQLHCVRAIRYAVAPLQRPVITLLTRAACDTGSRSDVFLARFRAFMEDKLKMPYPVTAEGCAADYYYDKTISPTPKEERVWCMINQFGYTRYALLPVQVVDCD